MPKCIAKYIAGSISSELTYVTPFCRPLTLARDLSARLGLPVEEGEKWIVHLIRDTRSDAKVDLKRGVVYMHPYQPSIHQQVIERTRGLVMRSSLLANAMDRRAHGNVQADRNDDRKSAGRNFRDSAASTETPNAAVSMVEVS